MSSSHAIASGVAQADNNWRAGKLRLPAGAGAHPASKVIGGRAEGRHVTVETGRYQLQALWPSVGSASGQRCGEASSSPEMSCVAPVSWHLRLLLVGAAPPSSPPSSSSSSHLRVTSLPAPSTRICPAQPPLCSLQDDMHRVIDRQLMDTHLKERSRPAVALSRAHGAGRGVEPSTAEGKRLFSFFRKI